MQNNFTDIGDLRNGDFRVQESIRPKGIGVVRGPCRKICDPVRLGEWASRIAIHLRNNEREIAIRLFDEFQRTRDAASETPMPDSPLVVLGFSARLVGILENAGISTAGQLVDAPPVQVLAIKHIGAQAAGEIREKVEELQELWGAN